MAVGLGAGGSYRRPLGGVQGSKLDSRLVGSRRHRPTHGIDFLYQMAFADSTYRGIAGHRAQGFDVVRQQQSAGSGARRRQRRLGAGVSATDNDYIEGCWIQHARVPNKKRRNHTPLATESRWKSLAKLGGRPHSEMFHVKPIDLFHVKHRQRLPPSPR